MSEKIAIKLIDNNCDLMQPETHSVGANLQSDSSPVIMVFPEHKKDELGNFNAAARGAFEEYLKDKDLTPKSKRLYSGKVLFINPNHEGNNCTYGTSCWDVIDGLIPGLWLIPEARDLRIEADMPCSKLTERVKDMYFYHSDNWSKRNKAMYLEND